MALPELPEGLIYVNTRMAYDMRTAFKKLYERDLAIEQKPCGILLVTLDLKQSPEDARFVQGYLKGYVFGVKDSLPNY